MSGLTLFLQDPEEKETGRHASWVPGSKTDQVIAAKLAWDKWFDRLTCGYKITPTGDVDPFISVDVVRELFDDSPVAYLRAECGLLPAPKPGLHILAAIQKIKNEAAPAVSVNPVR